MKLHPTATIDHTVRIFGRKDLLVIGAHSRIDAGCVLSVGPQGLLIGRYVHLAVGVCVFGQSGRVAFEDCSAAATRSSLLTATDGYAEDCLIGPTIPATFRKVQTGDITLCQGAALGVGTVLFPGVVIGIGATTGAYTLVRKPVEAGCLVVGPAQRVVRMRDWHKIQQMVEQCVAQHP